MKLLIAGGNSPTGKALTEQLRKRKLRFQAPADKHFVPENADAIARLVTDYQPTQFINLVDFISGSHGGLKRAESAIERCDQINARLPQALATICNEQNIPLLHLSNSYVFDGLKKLGYNENDDLNPQGVYGRCTLTGETAVQQHHAHIILRSGWLFSKHKKGLIKSWLQTAKRDGGILQAVKRRFSPTHTGDLAAAIIAICQQVDCDANVWGTYHYSGLETRRENEFIDLVLKYAAEFDTEIARLLDTLKIIERPVRTPEIFNSTLSSKKTFDTFGIRQRSWHSHLKETIQFLHSDKIIANTDTELAHHAS
ncbi:MAG: SDR family oxidoreductase [Pseudohongiellaceae bacterium]